MLKGTWGCFQFWIDYRKGIWYFLTGLMMVGNNQIDAKDACNIRLPTGVDTAIHRQNNVCSAFLQFLNGICIETVSLLQPFRYIVTDLCPYQFQTPVHERCR